MFTVWEFRSVDGRQVVRALRISEPMDQKYEHYYQRIVYRGDDIREARKFITA